MKRSVLSLSITTGNGRLGNQIIQAIHLASNHRISVIDYSDKVGTEIARKYLTNAGINWKPIYIKNLNSLSTFYPQFLQIIRLLRLKITLISKITWPSIKTKYNPIPQKPRRNSKTSIFKSRRSALNFSCFHCIFTHHLIGEFVKRNKAFHFFHRPLLSADYNSNTIQTIIQIKNYSKVSEKKDNKFAFHVRCGDFASIENSNLLYNMKEIDQLVGLARQSKVKPLLLSDDLNSPMLFKLKTLCKNTKSSSPIIDWNQLMKSEYISTNLSTFAISAFLLGHSKVLYIPTRLIVLKNLLDDPLFSNLCCYNNPKMDLFTAFSI